MNRKDKARINVLGIVTSLITITAATYGLINYFEISPLKMELEIHKKESSEIRQSHDVLSQKYDTLLRESENPILLSPTDGIKLIGDQVAFKWDYRRHNRHQNYILEIYNINDRKRESRDVPISDAKTIFYKLRDRPPYSQYFWRIKPGKIINEREVLDGPASSYHSFEIYSSVLERIKMSKQLIVGTSSTFSGIFNLKTKTGEYTGFDGDLIQWIAQELSQKLDLKNGLNVKFSDTPWEELLPKLQEFEFDVVISSLTSTTSREREFGIKFTKGYFQVSQIFISKNKSGKFPQDLEGRRIGATQGSTNQQVARYLKKRLKYKLDDSFLNFDALYQALLENRIDFAVVDNVFAQGDLEAKKIYQFGPNLDGKLQDFYKETFGRDSEMYAIAVTDDNLLVLIEDILASKGGKLKIEELKKKWI